MQISSTTSTLNHRTIVNAYHIDALKLISYNNSYSPYFVTTVFNDFECQSTDKLKRSTHYVLKQYDRVYRHIASILVKNFQTKPHLQPKTYDFVDLPGTKHTSSLNIHEPNSPHVHSIYLIEKSIVPRFEEIRQADFSTVVRHPSLAALQSIHALSIDPDSLKNVFGYAAKFMRNRAAQSLLLEGMFFTQHPIAKFERRQRGADLKFERMLERSKWGLEIGDLLFPPVQHSKTREKGSATLVRSSSHIRR